MLNASICTPYYVSGRWCFYWLVCEIWLTLFIIHMNRLKMYINVNITSPNDLCFFCKSFFNWWIETVPYAPRIDCQIVICSSVRCSESGSLASQFIHSSMSSTSTVFPSFADFSKWAKSKAEPSPSFPAHSKYQNIFRTW